MDLAELKNIDLNQLISKLKKLEILKDKKTLTKIGIFAFAFFISLIVYYSFVSPIIKQQKADIIKMEKNKAQIDNLNFQIEDVLSQTQELEPEYFKNSVLFHSKEEVEDLYQSISNFALSNGLTIVNIKKGEPKGVEGELPDFSMDNTSMTDMGGSIEGDGATPLEPDNNMGNLEGEGGNILYYEIPIDYEITGTFIGYLKFRRALSKSLKVINFDKEEINLLKQPQGQVLAKGTISIVGLANEYK